MKRVLALMFGLSVLAAVAAAQAQPPPSGTDSLGADWGAQQNDARRGVRQDHYLPLARVIAEIKGRTPGYQLDAGIEQENGRPVYRVRWAASNGRRIDYIVDAVSGAILSEQ